MAQRPETGWAETGRPDRRTHRATDRVAHLSIAARGLTVTAGSWHRLSAPLTDLTRADGARERQLPLGTRFCVIERRGARAFGFDAPDGYCGWVPVAALGADVLPTHWVAAPASHLYPAPDLKSGPQAALPIGARVQVRGFENRFARTQAGWVPVQHLRRLGDWLADPVAVARSLLGVPYLWGGNSAAGIDCSGLVQLAWRACGVLLPADSDQQHGAPGLRPDQPAPGDLVFWRGHVAMVSGAGRIIHANATHMAVTEDDLHAVCARIATDGGGPVTGYFRPAPR